MLALVQALETKLVGMEDTARRYLSYQKLLEVSLFSKLLGHDDIQQIVHYVLLMHMLSVPL
jgi:hypothetical protein